MLARRKPHQRRSLLRPAADAGQRLSFWKAMLIADGGIACGISLIVLLKGEPRFGSGDHLLTLLIALLFSSCITSVAVIVTAFIRRRTVGVGSTLRIGLLAIGWLLSGALGSLTAFALIHTATAGRVSFPSSWIAPMLLSNGALTIGIGIFLLVYEGTRNRLKQRAELIDQGELLTAEFRAARAVQQRLLPEVGPRLFGYDISGITEPAVEIGGDYFDYLTFAGGTKGIIVADAAGKGIPAALIMAKFQGMAQALSIHVADPREFFVGLNDALRIRLDRHTFITVGMLTIDFNDSCSFFRAGHNPMFLFRAATGEVERLRPDGLALGLSHGNFLYERLDCTRFVMDPADVALLYSDGLVEASNLEGEFFGDDRLAWALKDAAESGADAKSIRDTLVTSLRSFVGEAEPADDVTIVAVRRNG